MHLRLVFAACWRINVMLPWSDRGSGSGSGSRAAENVHVSSALSTHLEGRPSDHQHISSKEMLTATRLHVWP